MPQWELNFYRVIIDRVVARNEITNDPASLWTARDKSTQQTHLDALSDLAADGWELVSVTPIATQGWTYYLLFTFKRPTE